MDQIYTFTELARAFNFDSTSMRKLFDAKGVKARTLKVGKREIQMYSGEAHAVCRAERERRDAARAAAAKPSPVERIKAAKAVPAEQFEDLKALITARFDSLERSINLMTASLDLLAAKMADRHDDHMMSRNPPPVDLGEALSHIDD